MKHIDGAAAIVCAERRRSAACVWRGHIAAALAALVLLLTPVLLTGTAWASGPRWVTGPPYFTVQAGNPVVWYTTSPMYFTDPGELSASVSNAAANAMVAAAAGVWNVPTSAMTIGYGGALAEHVSGANAYLSSSGPVFPADVQSSNYAAIQIAVIYDSDGSMTDLLLGSRASSAAECRQNAVTQSVDGIAPAGMIQHAIVVLNGLCTGPAPQQQLEMQYQLERAFGRVLGLGWSQTNDNVFTGVPQATLGQALHWPIMHPIDILCGSYAYQCMPQPFTLRDDDVASMTQLYPLTSPSGIPSTPPAPGKIWSYQQASQANGTVSFPTGQGMQGVNVVMRREQGGWSIPEGWEDVSSVSGFLFQQNVGNPVTGAATGVAESMGTSWEPMEGYYRFGWIPDMDPAGAQNGPMSGIVTTEAVNSLYVGAYAVGPYPEESVEPSGSAGSAVTPYPLQPYVDPWNAIITDFAPADAASNCNTVGDGQEGDPLAAAASGWWMDVLCANRHSAWSSVAMQAGRTATLEMMALDEAGIATTAKAMPLIGVWAAADATGTLPTIGATPSAFNTVTLGMTATGVATAQAESLRFVVTDARGDGRPDFAYQARVLYADSIQPAAVSVSGGQITISGMGFRAGNEVLVNGVAATVSSWTANTIVAVAPPESGSSSGPVSVEVLDLSTGGSTTMSAALSYSGSVAPDVMVVVSEPTGTVAVGATATTPFAVRVLLGDGVTPVVGLPVMFTVSAGSAQLGACIAAPCMVVTDATGMASTTITPTAFGTITVQAAAVGAEQTATFNAAARSIAMVQAVEYIAAGATVAWTPQVILQQNGAPAAGVVVEWSGPAGLGLTQASSMSGALGVAPGSAVDAAVSGPLSAGVQASGEACAWTSVCASFAAVGVDPSAWRLTVVSGAGQAVAAAGTFAPVVVMVTDGSGDPVAGAPVAIYQTVDAAEMPCPVRGPCPMAPVLAVGQGNAVSDAGGLVSVTPMQAAGVPEETNVAVAAGTQGFVALALQQQ